MIFSSNTALFHMDESVGEVYTTANWMALE